MYLLPNAKINIGLYITEERPDGYHNLQTIFYPIPLTDSLELVPMKNSSKDYELIISGLDIPGNTEDNLVAKVFSSLQKEFQLPPTSIYLSKHIPMGAGLGGGSSDAAFIMKLTNEYFSLNLSEEEMEKRLSNYGADCPFFVRNKPVYAEGIGNIFSPTKISLKGYYLLLVKPDIHISTAQIYSLVSPNKSDTSLLYEIENTPIDQWHQCISNDFEKYAFQLHPSLCAIKQTLYDMGAVYASMSGSGSALYGIFTRPIDNGAKIFPDCFTFANKLAL